MLNIIRDSHTVTLGARASVLDMSMAIRTVEDIRQGRRPLEEYRQAFLDALTRCRHMGIREDRLSESAAIYHFIAGVTNPHGKTIRDILITQYGTAEFPLSIADAFARISAAIKAHTEAEGTIDRATTKKVAAVATKHKANTRGIKDKRMAKSDNPKGAKRAPLGKGDKCGYCDKPGHVMKDCFILKRRMETNGEAGQPRNKKNAGRDKPRDPQTKRRYSVTSDEGEEAIATDNEDDFPHESSKKRARFAQIASITRFANSATCMVAAASNVAASNNGEPQALVILDTGANIHIVNHPDVLGALAPNPDF